jgi:S-(hydroxymethyl)glutathione dehydrogenase/alcohol dehydrogenase
MIRAALGIGGWRAERGLRVCLPVFTDARASLFGVPRAIAAAMCLLRVEPGSDVVVLGAGAVGMAAIQGARVMGAAQIIAVEPIRCRDLALKLGATAALDPNAEGDGLVEGSGHVQGPTVGCLPAAGHATITAPM